MRAPLDLDAILARADRATDGPWEADESEIYGAGRQWVGETLDEDDHDKMRANSAFIAAARTDVPALVAELRASRAEVAEHRRNIRANDAARQADAMDPLPERTAVPGEPLPPVLHIRQIGAYRHNLCPVMGGEATWPSNATCEDCKVAFANNQAAGEVR